MTVPPSDADGLARRAAEDAARRSYGKLIACLAAQTRDLSEAEDALAEAFALALKTWPETGAPASPEAWLLTAARRRFLDAARRGKTRKAAIPRLNAMIAELEAEQAADRPIPDDRLRLIFACAHPAIDEAARAPLILQTVLGLDAAAIASAFLVSPAAMSQRLVRAKTKIRDAGVPFAEPDLDALPGRLEAALQAIYAVFTQGWSDPAGADPRSRGLVDEALFLGRLLAALMPNEPEPGGLLALMLYAHARRGARRDREGRFTPLDAQNTALWDEGLIEEAEALMMSALSFGRIGRFQIEAAIQSAHVHRRLGAPTDWAAIVELYDRLVQIAPSPVVALNRAIAIGKRDGAARGLAELHAIADRDRLAHYPFYAAALGELEQELGHTDAARGYFAAAHALARNDAERRFLAKRM